MKILSKEGDRRMGKIGRIGKWEVGKNMIWFNHLKLGRMIKRKVVRKRELGIISERNIIILKNLAMINNLLVVYLKENRYIGNMSVNHSVMKNNQENAMKIDLYIIVIQLIKK
jgi:hypothetical protein